mmetsp:Transcript_8749/g.32278  ORF Transcript_8749/g.32278 Transcript_8749/m.32278 type:complete len:398 (+) Transcript_8749:333-1526(+)
MILMQQVGCNDLHVCAMPMPKRLCSSLRSGCPKLPLLTHADWACWLTHKGGIFKFDEGLDKVQKIWLIQRGAGRRAERFVEDAQLQQEMEELRHGIHNYTRCRDGCDCRVQPYRTHPSMCKVNDMVRILNSSGNAYKHKKGNLTLVLAGEDDPPLSKVARYAKDWVRSGWFHRIFYEAADAHVPGVGATAKALDLCYLLGREEHILQAILEAKLTEEAKPRLAVGAWGSRVGINSGLNDDAVQLEAFLGRLGHDQESTSLLARVEARTVAAAGAYSGPFIERRAIDPQHYFQELAKYKFLVAPRGNGVQSPKFMEALLVMTIPVTKRIPAFEMLQSYGFPIVLVDEWEDLSASLLEQEWERLSPRLEKARWLTTVEGVESLYYGQCYDALSTGLGNG